MFNGVTLDTVVRVVLGVLALVTAVVNYFRSRRKD